MADLSIKSETLGFLLGGQPYRHESSGVLLVHEVEHLQRGCGLLFLEHQEWKQLLEREPGFFVESLPDVPPLVQRIFWLVRTAIPWEHRSDEIWDHFVSLAESDSNLIVNRPCSVFLDITARFTPDAYVPIGVDHSGNVCVGCFHGRTIHTGFVVAI